MALTTSEQAIAAIQRSNHTLVCFPEHASGDGVATSLGLARAIERLRPGHQVDVASSGFDASCGKRYGFLPGAERVRVAPRCEQRVKIRIPLGDPSAYAITHAARDGAVEIELTHEQAQLDHSHIATAIHDRAYDLIIVVGAPDLAMLGALYADNAALFQGTPTIALDHAPDHERYGHIHCIDVTASACGEVAAVFLEEVAVETMDAEVATCFLAGILAATRSFRTQRMSPKTFTVVSTLLACGARREDIVAHLFQTKTVPQLQLWGRALTRLRADHDRKLVWTILSQHDLLTAGASAADLSGIVEDLLMDAPDAQCVLFFAEQPDRSIRVSAYSPRGRYDAAALLRPLGGTGSAARAEVHLPAQPLPQATAHVLDVVKQRM